MIPRALPLIFQHPEQLGAFALLVRPSKSEGPVLEIYTGSVTSVPALRDIPLPAPGHHRKSAIAVVPYRQLSERGFACIDDGEPLQVISIDSEERVLLRDALDSWPDTAIVTVGGRFDTDDETYAERVREVIEREIGSGAGSNFVLKRTFTASLDNYTLKTAIAAFGRLVRKESGAYWTFLVHTGDRTWIGASPERHVSLESGVATMNPISGTYRYPSTGPTLDGILEFLGNRKENDELYMVVDEELKMMAQFCTDGGKVVGPHLREMSRLAHTEYLIEGKSGSDPRDILRHTLFSPAVTGSPIENACRVIARYESEGRGYYAGVLSLFGRDIHDQLSMDSTIMIRTADIRSDGQLSLSVGSTIVRHSDPRSEATEARTKAVAVLNAFGQDPAISFAKNPTVISLLRSRNSEISKFWQTDSAGRHKIIPGLTERELLIIDAEDAFTAMLGKQLQAIGLRTTIVAFDHPRVIRGDWDLAVFGPGPGNPQDANDPRVRQLRARLASAMKAKKPFFAVCLSHQLLCLELGLPIVCRPQPNQGIQREIDLFGRSERVGFYNTFNAISPLAELWHDGAVVEVCRDPVTHEVHALRGRGFSSIQFHAESVLTEHGIEIISDSLLHSIAALRLAHVS
jgi:2-amino-4-deoxychorismate synthase